MVVKVILWSASRCISTAFERSIRTLSNSKVFHEPFQRPFYCGPDKQRNLFSSLPIANDPTITYINVKSLLLQDYEGVELVFSKDLAYHVQNKFEMFLEDDCKDLKHSFLIRNPAQAVPSLYKGCINTDAPGYDDFSQADIGFRELYELYQFVTEHLDSSPVVVDADDLLDNPNDVMKSYCEAVGIQYEASMTTWEPAPWPAPETGFCKGWHTSVENSSGFIPRVKKQEEAQEELPEEVVKQINEATPYYNELALKKQPYIYHIECKD